MQGQRSWGEESGAPRAAAEEALPPHSDERVVVPLAAHDAPPRQPAERHPAARVAGDGARRGHAVCGTSIARQHRPGGVPAAAALQGKAGWWLHRPQPPQSAPVPGRGAWVEGLGNKRVAQQPCQSRLCSGTLPGFTTRRSRHDCNGGRESGELLRRPHITAAHWHAVSGCLIAVRS